MDLGIIFTGGGMHMRDMSALAAAAETAGFEAVVMAEAWRSGWVPLTAMAAATSRIRLGPYVLNAYGRSPLLAGMSAIDFNEFSGGRLMLGVGGGNRIINEVWQGIEHARVLTKMREYVDIMQRMARTPLGDTLTYNGKLHTMEWAPAIDPGAAPFPVYLAAVFPRMLRVAAQAADGIAAGATLSADYLRDALHPQAAAACAEIDRDPASLRWASVAITAVDDDTERARRAAREALCHLYAPLPHPYYEYTMREQGFGTVADALLKLMPAGDLEAAVAAIPDECVDRLTISGTPAACRRQLDAFAGCVDEILCLNAMPPTPGAVADAYSALLTLPAAT